MNKTFVRMILIVFAAALLMGSCSLLQPETETTPDLDNQASQVAQTVAAELTRLAEEVTPTPIPQIPSPTTIPPTPLPPPTSTPEPTDTPIPTPSPTPIPCNWAWFVTDVTVEDGTLFAPEEAFIKTWRLENFGSCTWTKDYDLVFVDGEQFGAESVVAITSNVLPGEIVDLSIKMFAPKQTGNYRGYWQLRNANGVLFGVGENADERFWVDIRVTESVNEPVYELIYDFALNACEADWQSGAGDLPCPGMPGDAAGFVNVLRNPVLENRTENEPTIWIHPNQANNGWVSGTYPGLRIEEGYHFFAWIGCMDASPGCEVEFQLDYQRAGGGPLRNLGVWKEVYDGKVTVIDLDLSGLVGRTVKLTFSVTVDNNQPEQADAFWFVPRIDKVEGIN